MKSSRRWQGSSSGDRLPHHQLAKFMSLVIEESTDVSNKEQIVICILWVDNAIEEFIGLHQAESTAARFLVNVVHDALLKLNVSVSKLRG